MEANSACILQSVIDFLVTGWGSRSPLADTDTFNVCNSRFRAYFFWLVTQFFLQLMGCRLEPLRKK